MGATLGDERRRAPCLPPHIFASLLALPIEHVGHGHPGLLYARRRSYAGSGPAELETLIEGYRMCYSFSAKATVTNLVADSLQQGDEQELAGWFFVGEGAGFQYASNIAESMNSQFRLAFSKAFAGLKKSLDEAEYDRACAMCSEMTGVVLLRSVGHFEGSGEKQGLRYEVHEFCFPLTRQKLKQEIRAKLKSNAQLDVVEESSAAGTNAVSSSSVCEVVDLISDDEEQDDDKPVIFLEGARKSSLAPHEVLGETIQPIPEVALASGTLGMTEGRQAAVDGAAPVPAEAIRQEEDASAARSLEALASERWKQSAAYGRWYAELQAIEDDPDHARDLYNYLEQQRQRLFENITSLGPDVSAISHASGSAAGAVQADRAEPSRGVAGADETGAAEREPPALQAGRAGADAAGVRLAPRPKLRIGVGARAVDGGLEQSVAGESAAPSRASAQPSEGQLQFGQVGVDAHERGLDLSLQEYDAACRACSRLLGRAHDQALSYSLAAGKIAEEEGNCPAILNSVMVSILNEAWTWGRGRAHGQILHGILAGFKGDNQVVVSEARAASEGLPPCAGAEDSHVGAAWLRDQAHKLFPQALVHPETLGSFEQSCAGSSGLNAAQDDGSAKECTTAMREESGDASKVELVAAEEDKESPARVDLPRAVQAGASSDRGRAAVVQCDGIHGEMVPCRDPEGETRPHQAVDVDEQSGREIWNRIERCHPEDKLGQTGQIGGQQSISRLPMGHEAGACKLEKRRADIRDGSSLTVLGYFRVAVTNSPPQAREVDRRRLCALNGQGIGLVCTIPESDQVEPSLDLAKFVCFGVDEEHACQMPWEVQQDPFLPDRVLRQWARASRDLARGQDGAEVAASLVKLHTMNLRVQEAYIKRQLGLPSVASRNVLSCTGVFRVGRKAHNSERGLGDQAHDSASIVKEQECGATYYETCQDAPGWRKYFRESDGMPYFHHEDRDKDTAQWEPPPGWRDKERATGSSGYTPRAGADLLTANRSAPSYYLPYPCPPYAAYPPPLPWLPYGGQAPCAVACAKSRKPPTCKTCGKPMKGHRADLCSPMAASPNGPVQKRPAEHHDDSQTVSTPGTSIRLDHLGSSQMPSKKHKCGDGE